MEQNSASPVWLDDPTVSVGPTGAPPLDSVLDVVEVLVAGAGFGAGFGFGFGLGRALGLAFAWCFAGPVVVPV